MIRDSYNQYNFLLDSECVKANLTKSTSSRTGRLLSRRSLLAVGLALSSGGWWQEGSARAADEIPGDASPKDVLAYLYSGIRTVEPLPQPSRRTTFPGR
jgi:hypothetical protein